MYRTWHIPIHAISFYNLGELSRLRLWEHPSIQLTYFSLLTQLLVMVSIPCPPFTSSTQTVGPMARTVATVALRSRPCSRIRRFWRHKLLRLKATWHLRSHLTRKLRQRCSHILFVLQCFCCWWWKCSTAFNCNRFNGSLINKCDVCDFTSGPVSSSFLKSTFGFNFNQYTVIYAYTLDSIQHSMQCGCTMPTPVGNCGGWHLRIHLGGYVMGFRRGTGWTYHCHLRRCLEETGNTSGSTERWSKSGATAKGKASWTTSGRGNFGIIQDKELDVGVRQWKLRVG